MKKGRVALHVILTIVSVCSGIQARNIPRVEVFEPTVSKVFQHGCKEFVVIIPSYNNRRWYEMNLNSVVKQSYANFEIVYIDDCSTDGTADLVAAYCKNAQLPCKVTLIRNSERCLALENLYNAIHAVAGYKIIVTVDGDDALSNERVLAKLNEVYSDSNVWMTYGQFKQLQLGHVGWCCPMPDDIVQKNAYREFPNMPSHLRTFYAWLFQEIKLSDLMHEGTFFKMTWDQAFLYPMMEMSGGRFKFIRDVLYVWNDQNAISDHRVDNDLQRNLSKVIRAKERYTPLAGVPEYVGRGLRKGDVESLPG
jgi:glycosyltransferase involved in cell wall biosynthesis